MTSRPTEHCGYLSCATCFPSVEEDWEEIEYVEDDPERLGPLPPHSNVELCRTAGCARRPVRWIFPDDENYEEEDCMYDEYDPEQLDTPPVPHPSQESPQFSCIDEKQPTISKARDIKSDYSAASHHDGPASNDPGNRDTQKLHTNVSAQDTTGSKTLSKDRLPADQHERAPGSARST